MLNMTIQLYVVQVIILFIHVRNSEKNTWMFERVRHWHL